MENESTVKVEHYFLILSLVFGLILAISFPPFHFPDEGTYILKAYDVSNGNIIPKSTQLTAPKNLQTIKNNHPINSDGSVDIDMSDQSIMSYPPLPYLANALIIKIGEFFNLSALVTMYVCRIINLLIYTAVTYFAVKKIPILKYALLLIALMPTTLYQAAAVSGDSLTMTLSFLVIALFLNLSLNKNKITKRDVFILSASTLALSLTKPSYALIALLFFIIPRNKFKNITSQIKTFLYTCLAPLSILIIWNSAFKHLYPVLNSGFNSYLQVNTYNITFVSSHPLNFLDLLINTTAYKGAELLSTFVVGFGNSGDNVPLFLIYIYLIVLLLTSVYGVSDLRVNLKQKIIGFIHFLIVSLTLCVAELITWTPLGSDVIWGLQGRYFIPIAPLLLLVFNSSRTTSFKKFYKKFHLCVILFIISFYITITLYSVMKN
ncbi:MAG: DUF2142 domain-containing protein [Methanobrevibacter sp.]|jgi:uncharacterized membrane protein|nr:DUF2142 domain-containing protein [Candidatus Methanovirga aequatorialis]